MTEELKTPPGPATGTRFEDPDKADESPFDVPVEIVPAHKRPENLDPRVNGPYLDEIHHEQEMARSEVENP